MRSETTAQLLTFHSSMRLLFQQEKNQQQYYLLLTSLQEEYLRIFVDLLFQDQCVQNIEM